MDLDHKVIGYVLAGLLVGIVAVGARIMAARNRERRAYYQGHRSNRPWWARR